MCMHCLEEGDWSDEDKCPRCEAKGHVSPWEVSKCPACNKEFFIKMAELKDRIDMRKNYNAVIANLQSRVKHLEESNANLSERLTSTGMERIGGCLSG